LPPRLLAPTPDKSLRFRRSRPGAPIGQLHDDGLMQQMGTRLGAKNGLAKLWLNDVNFHALTF
jgi:hypothetical protein